MAYLPRSVDSYDVGPSCETPVTREGMMDSLYSTPATSTPTSRLSKKSPGLGGSRIFASAVHSLQHASKSLIATKIVSPKDKADLASPEVVSSEPLAKVQQAGAAAILSTIKRMSPAHSLNRSHRSLEQQTPQSQKKHPRRSSSEKKKKKKKLSGHRRRRSEASTDGEQEAYEVKDRRRKRRPPARKPYDAQAPCNVASATSLSKPFDRGTSSGADPSSTELSFDKTEILISSEDESPQHPVQSMEVPKLEYDGCKIVISSDEDNNSSPIAISPETSKHPSPASDMTERVDMNENVLKLSKITEEDQASEDPSSKEDLMQAKKSSWVPLKTASVESQGSDKKYNPKAYAEYMKRKKGGGNRNDAFAIQNSSETAPKASSSMNAEPERTKLLCASGNEETIKDITSDAAAEVTSSAGNTTVEQPLDATTSREFWQSDSVYKTERQLINTALVWAPPEEKTPVVSDKPTVSEISTETTVRKTNSLGETASPCEAGPLKRSKSWIPVSDHSQLDTIDSTTPPLRTENDAKSPNADTKTVQGDECSDINNEWIEMESKVEPSERRNEENKHAVRNDTRGKGQPYKNTRLSPGVVVSYKNRRDIPTRFRKITRSETDIKIYSRQADERNLNTAKYAGPRRGTGRSRWVPVDGTGSLNTSRSVDSISSHQMNMTHYANPGAGEMHSPVLVDIKESQSNSDNAKPPDELTSLEKNEAKTDAGSKESEISCHTKIDNKPEEVCKDSLQEWDADWESSLHKSQSMPLAESALKGNTTVEPVARATDDNDSEPLSQDPIDPQPISNALASLTLDPPNENPAPELTSFEEQQQNLETFLSSLTPNTRAIRSSYRPPTPPSLMSLEIPPPENIDQSTIQKITSDHEHPISQLDNFDEKLKITDETKLEDMVVEAQNSNMNEDTNEPGISNDMLTNITTNESKSAQVDQNTTTITPDMSPYWAAEDEWDSGSETQTNTRSSRYAFQDSQDRRPRSQSPSDRTPAPFPSGVKNLPEKTATRHDTIPSSQSPNDRSAAPFPSAYKNSPQKTAARHEAKKEEETNSQRPTVPTIQTNETKVPESNLKPGSSFLSDMKKPLAIIAANPKPCQDVRLQESQDVRVSGMVENSRYKTRFFERSYSEHPHGSHREGAYDPMMPSYPQGRDVSYQHAQYPPTESHRRHPNYRNQARHGQNPYAHPSHASHHDAASYQQPSSQHPFPQQWPDARAKEYWPQGNRPLSPSASAAATFDALEPGLKAYIVELWRKGVLPPRQPLPPQPTCLCATICAGCVTGRCMKRQHEEMSMELKNFYEELTKTMHAPESEDNPSSQQESHETKAAHILKKTQTMRNNMAVFNTALAKKESRPNTETGAKKHSPYKEFRRRMDPPFSAPETTGAGVRVCRKSDALNAVGSSYSDEDGENKLNESLINQSSSLSLGTPTGKASRPAISFAIPPAKKKITFGLVRSDSVFKTGPPTSSRDSSPDRQGYGQATGSYSADSSSVESSPQCSTSGLKGRDRVYGGFQPVSSQPKTSPQLTWQYTATNQAQGENDNLNLDWFGKPEEAEKTNKKTRKKVSLPSTTELQAKGKRLSGSSFTRWSPATHEQSLNTSPMTTLNQPQNTSYGWNLTPPPPPPPEKSTTNFSLLPHSLQRLVGSNSTDKLQSVQWENSKQKFARRYTTTVPFIDSHCHLDFLFDRTHFNGNTLAAYAEKHSETFLKNFAGCIAVFCNPRTFHPTSGLWLKVLRSDPNVWVAVGCHPKSATDFNSRAEEGMRAMINHPKVKAVGEIGLDFSGTFSRHAEVQKAVLEKQCRIAMEAKKPIVIHSRDSEEAILDTLVKILPKNYKIHRHCFTGSWAEAETWLAQFPNSYIGLTPLVTWASSPRSSGPRHVAARIPLNRLLLETDAPYFLPKCIYRDDMEHSHPGFAITVAETVAQLQGVTIDAVLQNTLHNTCDMYDISQQELQEAMGCKQ